MAHAEFNKLCSNRHLDSSNQGKNQNCVLQTAGDEDDVEVEEYEDL